MTATDLSGFDAEFLGVKVALPMPIDAVPMQLLDYTHFSVLLRTDRRLAAVTGVGIDGSTLQDLDRDGIAWRLDPRVPPEQQVGDDVYRGNDLDRGHLVRRADAVWGATVEEAQQGNRDTFHYPNAAPQAAAFNQGKELWLGLEDYLLANAATYRRRLVVFTGPVLDPADPPYRGVRIPLQFFKIAVFVDVEDLAATGYLLDQSPLVDDLGRARADGAPPLGPYRTYQVPVAGIAALTRLDLDQLIMVDRFPPSTIEREDPTRRRRRLTRLTDIIL